MSDEHDAAVTGCYGVPLVQTPHLDRLAREGITFEAAYCNSPLCVPSRLSFTAGRYVSRVGAWNNNCWLPSDETPSLPRTLRAAGYRPYLCGKQHYDATRRYGFEDLLPNYNQSFKNGGGGRRAADDLSENRKSWEDRSADFRTGDESGIMSRDRGVTERASAFLMEQGRAQQADEGAEPFFLFAGYIAPHFPLIVPEALYEKYKGRTPLPVLPEDWADRMPLNYKHQRAGFGTTHVDPELVQKGRDLYWALTDWFDGQIGQLMGALKASGLDENTVVIYTSDHGENKGDHGLWWKNCLYDHGARVPLIVRWPQRWKGRQRRAKACSLVDVVKTVVDLAGGEAPADWDGRSLLPYLDSGRAPCRDLALTEYHGHNIASGITMLRKGRWKYVYHARYDETHGPEHELYDMKDDPLELRNLAGEARHQARLRKLHRLMVAELGEDPEAIEARYRETTKQTYGRVREDTSGARTTAATA